MKFITQSASKIIDQRLMSQEFGFRLEQLMELAGLSCAQAIFDYCSSRFDRYFDRVLTAFDRKNWT